MAAVVGTKRTPTKAKRSTERGEARAKLIAALLKHHGCRSVEPIGNNQLARLAGVDKATASAFFRQEFHSHATCRIICPDKPRLAKMLDRFRKELSNY